MLRAEQTGGAIIENERMPIVGGVNTGCAVPNACEAERTVHLCQEVDPPKRFWQGKKRIQSICCAAQLSSIPRSRWRKPFGTDGPQVRLNDVRRAEARQRLAQSLQPRDG